MRILIAVVAAIVGIALIVVVIGYSLPVKHRAQRQTTVDASADSVFSLITNVTGFASWRKGVKSAERLPPRDGKQRFREVSSNGTITYLVETIEPPRRLVTRIDDKSLPFGGTWTYEVAPVGAAQSTLRITEDGEIYNPVFRFVSRYIMGYDGTIREYLESVRNSRYASRSTG